MEDIKVSLCAAAMRVKDWRDFYSSLSGNKLSYEVIFVGPNEPNFTLPDNFQYIKATVKPAQCYQIAIWAAKGELVGWCADDCVYNGNHPDNLDRIYNFYKSFNDPKVIVAQRPVEDGRDIWFRHHFFGDWSNTPVMAPLGFMNRELLNEIGGYDKRFIAGQSENDIVMRVLEIGGRVERSMDSYVHISHRRCHETTPGASGLRQYYVADREFLENAWVVGGVGAYGPGGKLMRPDAKISKTRLIPFEGFEKRDDICFVNQGPAGKW